MLTLFVIFRVQYDEFRHLLYTKAYITWITYNVVRTYLQYNTITYDTNNTNAYRITHAAQLQWLIDTTYDYQRHLQNNSVYAI